MYTDVRDRSLALESADSAHLVAADIGPLVIAQIVVEYVKTTGQNHFLSRTYLYVISF